MSHASLGMQHQLLWQYCHGQCAFLTCVFFWKDKESTCCWPWQVPSVLVGLDAHSFDVVQFISEQSMSAAEKRKTPIHLRVNNFIDSSGVRGWHLIRSRAATIFCLTTSLVALISPFPAPQYPRYLHASSRFVAGRVSPLIVNKALFNSGAGSCSLLFLSLSNTNKCVFFTSICIPHQAVHSCTKISCFCMPSSVSAKIQISAMNPMLVN